MLNGELATWQITQRKLCHSRVFFLRAYGLPMHELLFDAWHHAFVARGGIPRHGIYDDMRTAFDDINCGKHREVNVRFSSMVSYSLCT